MTIHTKKFVRKTPVKVAIVAPVLPQDTKRTFDARPKPSQTEGFAAIRFGGRDIS